MKLVLAFLLPLALVTACGGRYINGERFVQLYDQDQSVVDCTIYTGRSFGRDHMDEYGLATGSVVHPTATYWTYTRDLPAGFPDHPQKERQPLQLVDASTDLGWKLSVEDARHALVALVELRHDAALEANLPALKDAIAIIEPGGGGVVLGCWRCDLLNRKFVYALTNPPVFMQIAGDFVRGGDQRWQARVTIDERN